MILINGSPKVGDDLTAVSGQIATVDAKVELVDNFVDTEVAAIKVETDKIPAEVIKTAAIKVETDKIGVVTDTSVEQTLLGYENTQYKHVHNPAKVYPTLASGVTLTADNVAWTLGAITQIVPASTITSAFDIHYVNIENASATDVYELVLYSGAALSEVEIGRVRTHKNSVQSGAVNVPIQVPVQAANARISAAIASSSGGADTLTVSLYYHDYN